MNPITDPHIPRFTFAGFTWPRYVATLTPITKLREKRKARRLTGGYYHAPSSNSTGRGFYLSDAGQPFTRWQWADDVDGSHIHHSGWWTDDYCDSKIRGIVVLLPHGRFLAGWSMGKGMASTIEPELFTDITEAAQQADECARVAAEHEREYQADRQIEEVES